ncbi:MAG: CHAT domain-containing protein, partial [Aurantibacter sp.]
ATKSSFEDKASQFDILHLAIHGTADFDNELNSKLTFQSESDSSKSNELYAYELYNLDLNRTRLAVLSACETGIGKRFKGEGTFSIARGFAYAGVPSIVMSLWKVDDAASAKVIQEFYLGLKSGAAIDLALDQAKDNYLNLADPYKAHPAYWAAFISLGDIRPPIPASNRSTRKILIWLFLGAIALAIIFSMRQKKRAA